MQISAFVDGELPENEAEMLLRRLSQDRELRQQAAEYFAIGRALRGQHSVAGSGELRARISAAIDDKSIDEEFDAGQLSSRRYVRPLAGFAIAATVALVAIFGLQQINGVSGVDGDTDGLTIADEGAAEIYTVPDLDYLQLHNQASSESGNNNFKARLVGLRLGEDEISESELVEIEAPTNPQSGTDTESDAATVQSQERQTP